jgi:hypothetical protein
MISFINSIIYAIKKPIFKYQQKRFNETLFIREDNLKNLYKKQHNIDEKLRVCFYQTGFQFHFTRFFTSSIRDDFSYVIVDQLDLADVIVFINTIDSSVVRNGQKVILFFHEPKDYSHLYQTTLDESFSSKKIQVVSHLESPAEFIVNPFLIEFHRSIPYVHFHHGAEKDQLMSIESFQRNKLICSIISGFTGIPGYEPRRRFIQQLSQVTPDFHVYGRYSKKVAALRQYSGQCGLKWQTLKNYRYNLVIENSNEEYYISEKIFDALICGCMPIYYGSEKIFEIIPEEWFYYLPNLNSDQIVGLEKFIKTDAYKRVSNNRIEITEKIYSNFSFYTALEKLIEGKPLIKPKRLL